MIITAPLKVPTSKQKNFILNLNNYRNAHYFVLNKSKQEYKKALKNQIEQLPVYTVPIHIQYVYYPKTKRRTDIGNVLSIHQKYFEDALTEFGKIEDDDYLHVPGTSQVFGNVDKDNPRVEILITKIESIK